MLGGVKLLFLLAVLMVLVPVTDPNKRSSSRALERTRSNSSSGGRTLSKSTGKSSPNCNECGKLPGSYGAKSIRHCKLYNKKRCLFKCGYTCAKEMTKSYDKKEFYMCLNKEWVPPPRGHCIADNFQVKEVTQFSKVHKMMNELIKKLFTSSYEFVAMTAFYKRADVALPGFKKLMSSLAEKDMKFAHDLISYEIERGESIDLQDIERPTAHEDLLLYLGQRTGKQGLEKALDEIKNVNAYVTEIIDQADPHKRHYLEDGILDFKVNTIKKLADLHYRLGTFESSEDYFIGEYRMDLELRE
ncbi:ferritin [Elysia marginata]|uniref:Ferritin n=1 Tax=Elysia marginata TaxID=1093978 RepID=A0AAV4EQ66_9GAST|nr:ferritin [Elysia marginata]